MVGSTVALEAREQSHDIIGKPSRELDFTNSTAVLNELKEIKPDSSIIAAAKIKLVLQLRLYLGNLNAIRDWGFAPEYAASVWLMSQEDKTGDFIVATGVGATVRDFCAASFSALGIYYREFVETEERYTRPTEVDALIGDSSKIERVLGWKAETHWKRLAEIMVESDFQNLTEKQN